MLPGDKNQGQNETARTTTFTPDRRACARDTLHWEHRLRPNIQPPIYILCFHRTNYYYALRHPVCTLFRQQTSGSIRMPGLTSLSGGPNTLRCTRRPSPPLPAGVGPTQLLALHARQWRHLGRPRKLWRSQPPQTCFYPARHGKTARMKRQPAKPEPQLACQRIGKDQGATPVSCRS